VVPSQFFACGVQSSRSTIRNSADYRWQWSANRGDAEGSPPCRSIQAAAAAYLVAGKANVVRAPLKAGIKPTRITQQFGLSRSDVGPGKCQTNSTAPRAHRRHIERAPGERSQEFGLRFGQVKPGKPVLRTKHHDLAAMIGSHVRSRRCRQHRERCRVIAVLLLQIPAIAVIGAPFSAKRCLAFGYFFPVKCKEGGGGMRQRLLLPKCRPSDRKRPVHRPAALEGRRRSSAPVRSGCLRPASPVRRR